MSNWFGWFSMVGLSGDISGLSGDVSGLCGDATGLVGDCTGLVGDLDLITMHSRMVNPNVGAYLPRMIQVGGV